MKKHKKQLRKLEAAFHKSEEPRSLFETEFEAIQRYKNDAVAIACIKTQTVIILGNNTMSTKELTMACYDLSEAIGADEGRYFITKYS